MSLIRVATIAVNVLDQNGPDKTLSDKWPVYILAFGLAISFLWLGALTWLGFRLGLRLFHVL